MPAVQPGSRWIQRHGRHEGTEAEVVDVNDVSVYLKNVGSNGARWGGQKSDDSKTYHLATDVFLARYVRREDAGTNPTNGGSSWRRVAKPKPKPVTVAPQQPLALNGLVMTGSSQLNIEVVEITPLQAQAWLDKGGANRKLSERRVLKLVAAIQRGEWQLTGDSIKLDADGTIRDGQHRLSAIVRAGLPVTSLVVRNVSSAAFDVIDTGATRRAQDVLAIHGYQYTNSLAAAARGLLLIERFGRYAPASRDAEVMVSNSAILRYTQAHETELHIALSRAELVYKAKLMGGLGLWAVFFVLCARANDEQAQTFADLLASGAELTANNPVLRLRNRLISDRHMTGTSQRNRETHLAVAIKAWNAWRADEEVRSLTWHGGAGEAFPTPI